MKLQNVLICLTCCAVATLQGAKQPNIVLILSDDQAWTDYGFMGHPDIKTPQLDKLASSGLRFDKGYVAVPLCRPSLASIVTGQFPVTHGIVGNDVRSGVYEDAREKLDKPLRNHFHHLPSFTNCRASPTAELHQLPSFIKRLTTNGYLAHQSGKWWEGSWQDGGFTHGMTKGERHGDKGLDIGREGMEAGQRLY